MTVRVLYVAALAAMMIPWVAVEADVPKSQDHPLIKRDEGSTIVRYASNAFDEYKLTLGPVKAVATRRTFPRPPGSRGVSRASPISRRRGDRRWRWCEITKTN
jgi:hypothetical protein